MSILGIWEKDILRGDPARPVETVTVTVTDELSGNVAEIFEDAEGNTALGNPASFNSHTVKFYARRDRLYRLDIQAGSLSRTLRNQSLNSRDQQTVIMEVQSISENGSIQVPKFAYDVIIPLKSDNGNVDAGNAPFGNLDNALVKTITVIGNNADDFVTLKPFDDDWGVVMNGTKFEAREFRIIKFVIDKVKKRIIEISRNL